MTRRHLNITIYLTAVAGCVLLFAGCGGNRGPERYSLTGQVKFEGKPVPHGFIMFTPDKSKGNEGPATGAPIVDGKYTTPRGKGAVGGPHVVKITGYDGVPIVEEGEELSDGTELFPPYVQSVELPKESQTMDFDVPPPK